MKNDAVHSGLSDVTRPFSNASTLPSPCFTSPEWYQKEVEKIFLKEWICVGREEQAPKAGDFFRFDIVNEPLVLVRDRSGKLHAHIAVCRHRAALLAQGKGNCRTFVCPYHSWTYALSGELIATPGATDPMAGIDNFDRKDYGLVSLRLETWRGFIFISFDEKPQPLLEWLGDLPDQVKNYKIEEMRVDRQFEWDIDCNWKVYYENSAENYHTATVHYRNLKGSTPAPSQFPESKGPYTSFFLPKAISALEGFPTLTSLTDAQMSGTWFILVQPNLQLILTPTYMVFRHFLPLGPERVKVVHNWCFPKSTVDLPDFSERVEGEYYTRYKPVIQEDVDMTPLVQQGHRSRFARPGRFAKEEVVLHHIENYVAGKVGAS
jgi:choline monooxygenase